MFEVSGGSGDGGPRLLIWPLGKEARAGYVEVALVEGRLVVRFALHLEGVVSEQEAGAVELAIKLARYVARTSRGGAWSPPIRAEVNRFLALVRQEQRAGQAIQRPDLLAPDWQTAPAWAQWWAVGAKGYAHWFEHQPSPKYGAWRSAGKSLYTGQSTGQRFVRWRESLRRRPDASG